jgi:hypothetical protein
MELCIIMYSVVSPPSMREAEPNTQKQQKMEP